MGAAARASAADLPPGSRLCIELADALAKGDPAKPVPLSLYATRGADGWGDVWGYEYDYNHRTHNGSVSRSEVAPDRIKLTIALDLSGDRWAPGGPAGYEWT